MLGNTISYASTATAIRILAPLARAPATRHADDRPSLRRHKTAWATACHLFLLVEMFVLFLDVTPLTAGEIIYLRADGTIEPVSAPIQQDGSVYTFVGDITHPSYDGIIIERSNIVVNGAGYLLRGSGAVYTYGIDVPAGVGNLTITHVTITNFYSCIRLVESSGNVIHGNTVTDSIGNDGIDVRDSSFNTISQNTLLNCGDAAVSLDDSSDNLVLKNRIAESSGGYGAIQLYYSSSNTISRNIIENETGEEAIRIAYSYNNTVCWNGITGNAAGLYMYVSAGNQFYGNTIRDSIYYGIVVGDASGNQFWHNNIIDNAQQVWDRHFEWPDMIPPSVITWDDGYPSGGNHWSDYDTVLEGCCDGDSDGICDEPYNVDVNNVDNYPFVDPLAFPVTAAEDWNSTTTDLIGSATCMPGQCPNTSTCIDDICYFTYNRYLYFHANNTGQSVALRVTHTGSGASRWIDSNVQQVVHNNSDPALLSYTFTLPAGFALDYTVWPQEPIAVTGCFIAPGEQYEIQATSEGCDPTDEGVYSSALTLPTAIFGDAVSTLTPPGPEAFAYPPQGPLVDVTDMTAIVEGFANADWTSKLYCDLIGLADDPSNNNAIVDVSDMTAVVEAFGGAAYPGVPSPSCP
jgi:parallel beta-helix repeat protein